MKSAKPDLLVGTDLVDRTNLEKLSKHSKVHILSSLGQDQLSQILSKIEVLLVFSWPKELDAESLQKMTGLKFIQSILAGVNHIPFSNLSREVVVASNAGAYSNEVAEYAWALLLSAGKRVVELHTSLREEKWTLRRTLDAGTEVSILKGGDLAILGFGGIGTAVAKIARGFGMRVYAYSRHPRRIQGVRVFSGEEGLTALLNESDVVVLALPLTNQTARIIDQKRLGQMKSSAVLVNIARGELVDEKALYDHLVANPNFKYATDVWWYRESHESLKTDFPFLSLPNFIGTPHVSGPSGLATGRPVQLAVENMLRFLRGTKPKNIADPKEYLTSYPY
ncbi:MAG TPA: 2-hydroxyacid dehydrogenase [Candidatus Dormibacteraeota bacterium]|jgi:phosphoglycerate dehydrogenase-like enzyme|nr:2-hydroxyacid dehydrogenase [Candidatus Dormibacteraeota bacterium]